MKTLRPRAIEVYIKIRFDVGMFLDSQPVVDCGSIERGQEISWRDTTSAGDIPQEPYPYWYGSCFARGERHRSYIRKRPSPMKIRSRIALSSVSRSRPRKFQIPQFARPQSLTGCPLPLNRSPANRKIPVRRRKTIPTSPPLLSRLPGRTFRSAFWAIRNKCGCSPCISRKASTCCRHLV